MSLYETAQYVVIKKEKHNIEIRKYPILYLAQTKTKVDNRYSNGFNSVFNYISGNNKESQKISMTTPVISQISDETLSTSFVIPSKFSDKAPIPNNPNVTIEKMDEGFYAVIRFNGSWNQMSFAKYNEALTNYLSENNYKVLSDSFILRYQPPFIPSFFRRNEIMYQIEVSSEILEVA